ncbi:MAG: serine hydrolase [Planctomycetes bacterium]|nr:serine hydrolase [Planctomycetota bacterium]
MLLAPMTVGAQDVPDFAADRIDRIVKQRMAEKGIPALSLGIVVGGEVVYERGFGRLGPGRSGDVDARSLYQIASISKMFTGIIANALIAEGVLDPEASITTYLRDVLQPDALRRLAPVRVRHLLNHTSGIPSRHCLIYSYVQRPRFAGYSEAQLIRDLDSVRLERTPGKHYEYSNSGYAVLGYICELAGRRSFRALVREHVTARYGLQRTTVTLESDGVDSIIESPPRSSEVVPWRMSFGKGTPASGVVSCVEDLTALMVAQLRAFRATAAGDAAESAPLVLTGSFADAGHGERYGYGIFEHAAPGSTRYSHSGSVDRFYSAYDFTPAKNLGVVLLAVDDDGFDVMELQKEIYAEVSGAEYEPGWRQSSLARRVFETALEAGGDAGVAKLRELRESRDYYLAPDEFRRAVTALITRGRTAAARQLDEMHDELYPATRRPLAHTLAFVALADGAEAARRCFAGQDGADQIEAAEYVLREDDLNRAAYAVLEQGKSELAIALFELNARAFPGAPNTYDSLGDAYRRAGDERSAARSYRTALALDPSSPTAKAALDQLRTTSVAAEATAEDSKDDRAMIRRTLQDYIEGSTRGEPERLRRAFHPDLNLYSVRDGAIHVWPGTEYITEAESGGPTGETGRILSIDFENDAAMAKVMISPPRGARPFLDFFMLLKVDGRWVIVHKLFTRRRA